MKILDKNNIIHIQIREGKFDLKKKELVESETDDDDDEYEELYDYETTYEYIFTKRIKAIDDEDAKRIAKEWTDDLVEQSEGGNVPDHVHRIIVT